MRRINRPGEARSLGSVDIRGDPWFRVEEVLFVPASAEPADRAKTGASCALWFKTLFAVDDQAAVRSAGS